MTVASTTPYPGGTGNSPNSIYVYDGSKSWPQGIAAVPNLANADAPTQSTVNSQPISTPFNTTGLSDSPPPVTVTSAPVYNPTAQNAVHTVAVSGIFGVVRNPA